MKDARDVCKHDGDCSIWGVNPATDKQCKICDCGALHNAILKAGSSSKYDDLWNAWGEHLVEVHKSYGV
jgi:hypothetical protein